MCCGRTPPTRLRTAGTTPWDRLPPQGSLITSVRYLKPPSTPNWLTLGVRCCSQVPRNVSQLCSARHVCLVLRRHRSGQWQSTHLALHVHTDSLVAHSLSASHPALGQVLPPGLRQLQPLQHGAHAVSQLQRHHQPGLSSFCGVIGFAALARPECSLVVLCSLCSAAARVAIRPATRRAQAPH